MKFYQQFFMQGDWKNDIFKQQTDHFNKLMCSFTEKEDWAKDMQGIKTNEIPKDQQFMDMFEMAKKLNAGRAGYLQDRSMPEKLLKFQEVNKDHNRSKDHKNYTHFIKDFLSSPADF